METLARASLVPLALAALLAPRAAAAQSVDAVVDSHRGGCTTAGVEGLSRQLVRSHLCAYPGAVAELPAHPNIRPSTSRVHLFGTAETAAAIRAAADRTPLTVTSAFRTLVEQYLLYHEGGCGLAATPGRSNHQSGRAVDLSNYGAARSAMTAAGCVQSYPSRDPVHYDCPGPDMREASVLVFQRLWNHNHPEDAIAEDGLYGPQTGARLGRSPAGGFPADLCDAMPSARWGAAFVAQTFPLASEPPVELRPGEEAVGTIELENVGTEVWDGDTKLGTTEPRDGASPLAASDWPSPHRAAVVEGTVEPGESYPFTFSVRAPAEPGRHCQFLGVVQEGVAWFSDPGQLGPPDDRIQVCVRVLDALPADGGVSSPGADAGVPSDAAVGPDAGVDGPAGDAALAGGCAASPGSGGGAPLALGLLALVWRRRRRAARA